MKIQYGHFLTSFAILAAATASSVEDVLAGLSQNQLEDIFNGLDLVDDEYGNYDPKGIDYEDQPVEEDFPAQLVAQRAVDDETADVNERNDVPKTEPAVSQGNQGHANSMLPAYCDPPNPCPLGYTSADGCIEDFDNTSEFSRRYQATQKCICDTEHMFDCPEENAHRSEDDIAAVNILTGIPGINVQTGDNPYLEGHKLPVAAKKGMF